MDQPKAESAIITSAVVVAGMYAYRKLTEPAVEKKSMSGPRTAKGIASGVIGTGELLPVGPWVTGFGASFIVFSILASISPNIGGYGAILMATGSFLGNAQAVHGDLSHALRHEPAEATESETEKKQKVVASTKVKAPTVKGQLA